MPRQRIPAGMACRSTLVTDILLWHKVSSSIRPSSMHSSALKPIMTRAESQIKRAHLRCSQAVRAGKTVKHKTHTVRGTHFLIMKDTHKNPSMGAGVMAQQFKNWLLLQKIQVPLPAPMWQPTIVWKSSSRRPDALFWPLQVHTDMICLNNIQQNTHPHSLTHIHNPCRSCNAQHCGA